MALLLLSEIELAPEDAPLKVTVQVLDPPAETVAGAQVRETSPGTALVRLRLTLAEPPPSVPVMVADWLLDRLPAVILKVAELALAGTVTELGTVNEALVLLRITVAPFVSAGLLSVTVQVVLELAARLAGHCKEETVGWLTRLSAAVWDNPPRETVMVGL